MAQGQRQFVNRVSKLLHRRGDPTRRRAGSGSRTTGATQSPSGATTATVCTSGAVTQAARRPGGRRHRRGRPRRLRHPLRLPGGATAREPRAGRAAAVHRYEASHRNRRTILNRAHQILATIEATGEAVDEAADEATPPNEAPPEGGADEAATGAARHAGRRHTGNRHAGSSDSGNDSHTRIATARSSGSGARSTRRVGRVGQKSRRGNDAPRTGGR